MTLQALYEKWNKITELLIKDHHLKPDEIPTVSQLLDFAKKYDFQYLGMDSAIRTLFSNYSEKRNLIVKTMIDVGFLEADDESSWGRLNREWERDSKSLYNQDLNRRREQQAEARARNQIKNLDEDGIQMVMAVSLDDPKYVYALRKVNAEREYYKDYGNLTKEDKEKVNSNDISELIKFYYDKKDNPDLQDFINNRIERLMHMKKAFGEASQKALDDNQKSPYGDVELKDTGLSTTRMWFPDMKNQHPGLQSTTQGCWSVTLSALLKHRGIEVSQNDLRQYKPSIERDLANKDSGQALGDYKPIINELLPNTMFLSAQRDIEIPVDGGNQNEIADAKKKAKEELSELLDECIGMSKSPIGLLINGHYRIVYGVESGNNAENVYIHDPYSNKTSSTTLDELIQNNLNKKGKCSFSVNWIQGFDLDKDGKLEHIPDPLSVEINNNPGSKSYIFETAKKTIVNAELPDKMYTEEELQKLREESAVKWKKSKALEDKLNRWDKNTKESLSQYDELSQDIDDKQKKDQNKKNKNKKPDIKAQIKELETQVQKLKESVLKNQTLLTKIEETLKDAPSEEEFTQAKEIISPKKLDALHKNSPDSFKKLTDIRNELAERQKSVNDSLSEKTVALQTMVKEAQRQEEARLKELEDNQKARRELIDTYKAIVDTRNYGRKSHEPFQRMVSALRDYNMKLNPEAVNLFREEERQEAAKNLHDTCIAYLEKHIVTDKSGKTKIGGQTYETGVIRKQAAVQILELLEDLPEYKKAMQKQQKNPVAEEVAEPKKGNEVKREKINFNQLKGELKDSLKKHKKSKHVAPGKEAAYADLDAAKAKLRR